MKANFKGAIRDLYSEAANSYSVSGVSKLEDYNADKVAVVTSTIEEKLDFKDFQQIKALIDNLVGAVSEKAFEVGFRKGMNVTLDGLSER